MMLPELGHWADAEGSDAVVAWLRCAPWQPSMAMWKSKAELGASGCFPGRATK